MSLLQSKSRLSNPLLSGSTSSTAGSLGLGATKRKASNDGQAMRSSPSKQKLGGLTLGSGSLLLGSSLLGQSGIGKKEEKTSATGFGLRSSGLGLKSSLLENKLLSSPTSLSIRGMLAESTSRSTSKSSAPERSRAVLAGGGKSLLGKQKSHGRPSSNEGRESKAKKVKSQQPQDYLVETALDSSLTTCELPDYDFARELPVVKPHPQESVVSFDKLDDIGGVPMAGRIDPLTKSKQQFINAISASLIGGPNFHERGDLTRREIKRQAEAIIGQDAEFVLKVALYTRKELNIRTTANFLLALAAMTPDCRPFLRKYFSSSINLPSDWIDVAELYQTFHDKNINYGSLPSALRKAMIDRFPKFDQYQLAKYNKDKKKKKKETKHDSTKKDGQEPSEEEKKKKKKSESQDSDDEGNDSDTDEEEVERLSFTLKQLIRKLHITEPVDSVMCLLGKRYPENLETFYQSHLPGTWDADRAGKRMKLPTPETWETQVSLKGNKAPVWEQLIDNKKLPFMAMLRNLRNMIAAGISEKHHKWVIYKLTDRGSVVNSRQFPFRFFSAYDVLTDMERDIVKAEKLKEENESGVRQPRGKRARKEDAMPNWKKKKLEKKLSSLPYDMAMLNRYRKALDTAVKIATSYNVKPIPGKTVILCNVGGSMEKPCTSARGLGKKRTTMEVGILLGLMCKYSCEDCSMIIYAGTSYLEVQLESGTILDNMASVLGQARVMTYNESSGEGLNPTILGEILRDRVELDNLMILSNGSNQSGDEAKMISNFLTKYRHIVNSNLLYVNVNLGGGRCCMATSDEPTHPNDIFIAGYSDQILRFIAERGDTGQVTHVENIDKAYGLDKIKIHAGKKTAVVDVAPEKPLTLLAPQQTRRTHTLRVFISSTFRDMHGERDLLTRFVFPELRAKARTRFVNLYEVDLRWGVNEEQTKHSSSVEICLREAKRCDLFLGMLGNRYGYMPPSYPDLSDEDEFYWLRWHPDGRSITELEMYHKALYSDESTAKAFFYIRNSEFLKDVPNKIRGQFEDSSDQTKEKLANLKDTIRNSGCEVFDSYPCKFGGVVEGKPVVMGLEDFGRRVINNVWNYIENTFPEDGEILDEVAHEGAQHNMFLQSQLVTFTGRQTQLKQCLDVIKKAESNLVLLSGKHGCGKTALLASVVDTMMSKLEEQDKRNILIHFVGAVSGSAHVTPLLRRLCSELQRRFGLEIQIPQEYKNLVSEFPRFLEKAATHVDSTCKLVIFIDGINNMDTAYQARNLDWLPQNIPQNVVFVLSAVSGTPAHAAAVRRQATVVELGPLDLMDKAEVVRRTLASYHKTLDESPFNNQMKLLVSKKEANLPLFLKLACEELRVFGVFEEVSIRLKAMSHTISTLLQEVLKRLEDDHGVDIITTALALLVSSRDGLLEEDLHHLLSLHINQGGTKYGYIDIQLTILTPEHLMPKAVLAKVVRGIRSLLAPTGEHSDGRLKVSHGQISQAIVQRYMKGAASELQQRTNCLLAGYFRKLARSYRSLVSPWVVSFPYALTELPYHLVQAGLFRELQAILSDPFFIQAKCEAGLITSLLEDFQANTPSVSKAVLREREKFLTNPLMQAFRAFLSRNLHILTMCPQLLWQQALNEPDSSAVREEVLDCEGADGKGVVTWRNKREVADECSMTLTGFTQAVLCVAIAPGDQYFAVGTKNCQLKLFELATGKELKNFVGHSDAVTACCFVGPTRLVSASKDHTLSLWDVDQGYRVNVLKGHKALVSGCISDPKGGSLASCGWDCRVLIWDGRSGKQTADITEPRPIGCLSYHPDGKLLVTGSWDSTLKIWDVFNKKRVAILRGHQSSVRAVTYSPTGRHIASASLDGGVKLWSASTGTQVGSLCGHSEPINHITFSRSGRELVTVSNDHKVKVWSGNLGKQLAVFRGEKKDGASQTVISWDGSLVAMGYHSGVVKVVDVATRQELYSKHHQESRVRALAWCDSSADERHLLVGFESGRLVVFAGVTSKKRFTVQLQAMHSAITSIAYDRSCKTAVACYEDMSVALWHLDTGDLTVRTATLASSETLHPKCNGVITSCAFNSKGTKLVLGTRDAMLFMYSLKNGKVTSTDPTLELHGCHKDWINACSWAPNTNLVATASNDSSVKLWDMKTGKVKAQLTGHSSAVYSVAFSHGCIVSGALNAEVKVWSHSGVEITTLHGHSDKVNKVDIHVPDLDPDDKEINFDEEYTPKETGGVEWAAIMAEEDWKERHEKKKLDKVSKVKLEDVIVASASEDGTTQLWKPLQGNELTNLIGHSDRVLSVAMATNGQVVTASMDCTVKVWSPELSPDSVQHGAHNSEVTSVAVSTKTSMALSASRDGMVSVWKMPNSSTPSTSLAPIHSWKASESSSANSVAFVGNHKSFVVGSDDGTVTKWHMEELKDSEGSFTVVKDQTFYLNTCSFQSMPAPVTSLCYDDTHDTLYIGTWASVISLRNFSSGKTKQNTLSLPDWVLDVQLAKDKGVVASLANSSVAYCKVVEKRVTTVDIPGTFPHPSDPWQYSLTLAPAELKSAPSGAFLTGNSHGSVITVTENEETSLAQKVKSAVTRLGTNKLHIVSASSDGTVKFWDKATFTQVGQFFCPSPVTALSTQSGASRDVLCGDRLGNIYLLTWKD
ncbi:telomerase protein component 1-like [Diadema antillarum]|uniref:telomerase protein component 1-like n=1 Tax=Diadema antillarum TaxID=105358 RepID=UPI003A8613DF